ncbi:uncharacterized protein LOC114461455 [Gouania willdenowi]|uniref:uncharacterized protein LOC114461455 n=1 Tax=Gouania willdenowi TaxID=441366 RepID=UPI0010551AA4|nr:uncharacterized protein LOC114461455 [Gouania willdenowi]
MSSSPSSPSSPLWMKVLLVLLTMWLVASVALIVVWSSKQELNASAGCEQDLEERENLQLLLYEARQDTENLRERRVSLLGVLASTNSSLWDSRQENVILRGNISLLEQEVETLRQKEENLTALLQQHQEQVELLVHNVTQTELEVHVCFNLKEAAQSHMTAAQSQTEACRRDQDFLHRQLSKCKLSESHASKPEAPPNDSSCPSPGLSVMMTMMMLISALHLTT